MYLPSLLLSKLMRCRKSNKRVFLSYTLQTRSRRLEILRIAQLRLPHEGSSVDKVKTSFDLLSVTDPRTCSPNLRLSGRRRSKCLCLLAF